MVHASDNVESCKDYLNKKYGRGVASPQRMVCEVLNGKVIDDPHTCGGQNRGGGVNAGFNKYWEWLACCPHNECH